MSLAAGMKLGPYEIQSPLGAGGMGEVYKARDTRLDRTVAVKVLPAALSGDAEIGTMATLNIKNLSDSLYRKLQKRAKQQHRSVAQEVTRILDVSAPTRSCRRSMPAG